MILPVGRFQVIVLVSFLFVAISTVICAEAETKGEIKAKIDDPKVKGRQLTSFDLYYKNKADGKSADDQDQTSKGRQLNYGNTLFNAYGINLRANYNNKVSYSYSNNKQTFPNGAYLKPGKPLAPLAMSRTKGYGRKDCTQANKVPYYSPKPLQVVEAFELSKPEYKVVRSGKPGSYHHKGNLKKVILFKEAKKVIGPITGTVYRPAVHVSDYPKRKKLRKPTIFHKKKKVDSKHFPSLEDKLKHKIEDKLPELERLVENLEKIEKSNDSYTNEKEDKTKPDVELKVEHNHKEPELKEEVKKEAQKVLPSLKDKLEHKLLPVAEHLKEKIEDPVKPVVEEKIEKVVTKIKEKVESKVDEEIPFEKHADPKPEGPVEVIEEKLEKILPEVKDNRESKIETHEEEPKGKLGHPIEVIEEKVVPLEEKLESKIETHEEKAEEIVAQPEHKLEDKTEEKSPVVENLDEKKEDVIKLVEEKVEKVAVEEKVESEPKIETHEEEPKEEHLIESSEEKTEKDDMKLKTGEKLPVVEEKKEDPVKPIEVKEGKILPEVEAKPEPRIEEELPLEGLVKEKPEVPTEAIEEKVDPKIEAHEEEKPKEKLEKPIEFIKEKGEELLPELKDKLEHKTEETPEPVDSKKEDPEKPVEEEVEKALPEEKDNQEFRIGEKPHGEDAKDEPRSSTVIKEKVENVAPEVKDEIEPKIEAHEEEKPQEKLEKPIEFIEQKAEKFLSDSEDKLDNKTEEKLPFAEHVEEDKEDSIKPVEEKVEKILAEVKDEVKSKEVEKPVEKVAVPENTDPLSDEIPLETTTDESGNARGSPFEPQSSVDDPEKTATSENRKEEGTTSSKLSGESKEEPSVVPAQRANESTEGSKGSLAAEISRGSAGQKTEVVSSSKSEAVPQATGDSKEFKASASIAEESGKTNEATNEKAETQVAPEASHQPSDEEQISSPKEADAQDSVQSREQNNFEPGNSMDTSLGNDQSKTSDLADFETEGDSLEGQSREPPIDELEEGAEFLNSNSDPNLEQAAEAGGEEATGAAEQIASASSIPDAATGKLGSSIDLSGFLGFKAKPGSGSDFLANGRGSLDWKSRIGTDPLGDSKKIFEDLKSSVSKLTDPIAKKIEEVAPGLAEKVEKS